MANAPARRLGPTALHCREQGTDLTFLLVLRVDRDVFLRQALLFNLIMGGLMYYGAYNLTSTVTFVWLCNLGVQGVVSLINLVAVCLDDVGVGIGML